MVYDAAAAQELDELQREDEQARDEQRRLEAPPGAITDPVMQQAMAEAKRIHEQQFGKKPA